MSLIFHLFFTYFSVMLCSRFFLNQEIREINMSREFLVVRYFSMLVYMLSVKSNVIAL